MFTISQPIKEQIQKKSSHFERILKTCLKVKKEQVLIIADHGRVDYNLAEMFAYGYFIAAQKRKLHVEILFQDPKKGFMQADKHVTDGLLRLPEGSIIIATISNKLGRIGLEKSFRGFCKEKGHRFISSTGLGDVKASYLDIFLEAMKVNYARLGKVGNSIKKKWDKAKEIRVTTQAGTDLTFNVEGKEAIANVGEYTKPGTGGNMPTGEVYMPPAGFEGVNGTLVIDASMKTVDGAMLVDQPITIIIKDGRVQSMAGKHAHLLESTFEKFEDRAKFPERIRLVAELAIGINPGAVVIGSMILDEKVLGTGHIAFGSNYWFGGDIKSIFHGDQVFKKPTFYLDGIKME